MYGLDIEVHKLLHGDNSAHQPAYGHWALLRWYRTDTKSKYYDANSDSNIGGPRNKYLDYMIMTSYNNSDLFGLYKGLRSVGGLYEKDKRQYIIEKCFKPKIGDEIMEFQCETPTDPEAFLIYAKSNRPYEVLKIYNVEPIKENNRIVYYSVLTETSYRSN